MTVTDEPANLREWTGLANAQGEGRLFTCGRPGRATFGREKRTIPDDVIDSWVAGLPQADVLDIVSLLGKKTSGFSEFGYYPFRSALEAGSKPTFQKWLDERYGRRFAIHEYPTVDAQGSPRDVLEAMGRHVLELIAKGGIVVVIDSAGAERTARVCEAIGYKRATARGQQPNKRMQPTARRARRG
jgi:hypothetical protein